MSEKPYSQAALRALIETFLTPMVVVVPPHQLWLANTAYLRMIGVPREQVEGQSFLNFVNQEERSRLEVRLQLFFAGPTPPSSKAIRRLLPSTDGGTHDVASSVQEVQLENGKKGMLISLIELPDRPPVLTIAERLVET